MTCDRLYMDSLPEDPILECAGNLPLPVAAMLKQYPGKLVVAGGFLRSFFAGEEVFDIDIFSLDTGIALNEVAQSLKHSFSLVPEKVRFSKTKNCYSITRLDVAGKVLPTVQLIHRWTQPTALELLERFDFTICQAALWYNMGWKSIGTWYFLDDIKERRLRYTAPRREEEEAGSLLRVLKYVKRGYQIPIDDFAAVVARASVERPDAEEAKDPDGWRTYWHKVATGQVQFYNRLRRCGAKGYGR